jgi:IMP dehydrogenase
MDTVTETDMAITMAVILPLPTCCFNTELICHRRFDILFPSRQLLGGIGIIHHNMPAHLQASMVRAVKKYENVSTLHG